MTVVKITQIPQLNSVVIKQEGGNFFIATKDSIIIDKDGFIRLIKELTSMKFISSEDLSEIVAEIGIGET